MLQVWRLLLLIAAFGFLLFQYGEQIRCVGRLIGKVYTFILLKKTFPPVQSEEINRWDEPTASRHEALGNDKKVLWGYWHQGEANLPGFCQLAIESWKVHHPDWNVIILSEANFRHFVSPDDLPSTFFSLKVQHQSDLVRLAVLKRYGGIYLDVSYVLFRALDDIWNQAESSDLLYLTSPMSIPSENDTLVPIPNNALLIAPNANNPVLSKWQTVMLEYLENPSYEINAMTQHPLMQRIAQFIGHDAFGPFKVHAPYCCNLWTLADTLYFEPSVADYVRHHVYFLPTLQWTVDVIMVDLITTKPKEISSKHVVSFRWCDLLAKIPSALRVYFRQEAEVVDRLRPYGFAMKVSSDLAMYWEEPVEFHASLKSNFGLMMKEAIAPPGPITQATTEGAYLATPFV